MVSSSYIRPCFPPGFAPWIGGSETRKRWNVLLFEPGDVVKMKFVCSGSIPRAPSSTIKQKTVRHKPISSDYLLEHAWRGRQSYTRQRHFRLSCLPQPSHSREGEGTRGMITCVCVTKACFQCKCSDEAWTCTGCTSNSKIVD